MTKTKTALVALTLLSIGSAAFAVTPAAAQERTPPSGDIQDLVPTIDLRPGQIFRTQREMYGVREGRSVGRDAAPDARDQGAMFDR